MTTRNGSPLTWTVDNLPASLGASQGSSTFSYGPDRARYQQTATYNGSTATTTYIGGLFEVVATATSTDYRHNIIADGQVIAVHTIDESGNATTRYLHYDHLGSVDTITDDQGNIAQQMSFDAFGLRRDATNWDYDLTTTQISALKNDTDRGYTFQEQLDNVGLIHMNGRVYDPNIAKFLSPDPALQFPYFSQSFNRYSYVFNNPLSWTDPTGYDACMTSQQSWGGSEIAWDSGGMLVGGIVGGVVGFGVGAFTGEGIGGLEGASWGEKMGGLGGAFLGDYLYGTFCGQPNTPTNTMPQVSPKPQSPKNPKPQPPSSKQPPPKPKSPNHGPGGGGGGPGSGPNRNAQFVNLAPVTCTYTWYDYYSNGKYIGSGSVSVECD